MVIKKDFEDIPAGNNRGTRPFILRKGKSVMKSLFKEESFRTEVQVAFASALASKVRQEILSHIPGDTDWPFWNEMMLSGP